MFNYGQGITNKDTNISSRKNLLKYYISKNFEKINYLRPRTHFSPNGQIT